MQTMQCGETAPARGRRALRRAVTSSELLGNARELIIEHGGEEYRLRLTSNEKLILTK